MKYKNIKENKMNIKKILLLGASLESDNRGVNALGIGAITLLSNNYKNADISLLCIGELASKEKQLNMHGEIVKVRLCYYSKYEILKSIKEAYFHRMLGLKPKLELSKQIQSSDIVFDINEGDSFSDIYGLKRILRHFTDSKLILAWNKPLIFLPQTIGPFTTFIGEKLGEHILKRIKKLYIRDDKALKFLNQLGVDRELVIDMAVYMTPENPNIHIKPNTVGINVSGLMYLKRYKSLEGKYENYPIFIHELVKRILNDGFEVLLIPHTYNAINPNEEDDLEGIKKFINDYPDVGKKVSYLDKDYTAQELKYIISKTTFFLGSRMHSCIAALSTSVPTIGLAYSYKFEGTFNMFKQKSLVMDVNNLNEDLIQEYVNRISNAISNAQNVKLTLLEENKRQLLVL